MTIIADSANLNFPITMTPFSSAPLVRTDVSDSPWQMHLDKVSQLNFPSLWVRIAPARTRIAFRFQRKLDKRVHHERKT